MDATGLLAEAREMAAGSYSPYSGFRVGSVVVATDGRRFYGANVENAAYGSSICAEANAISTAVSAGVRKIDTVAVGCLDAGECQPCGNCRQLMQEFGVETVVVQNDALEPEEIPLEELMPRSFGPDTLGAGG